MIPWSLCVWTPLHGMNLAPLGVICHRVPARTFCQRSIRRGGGQIPAALGSKGELAMGDFRSEDQNYEQSEERYTEGDDGTLEEVYLLDPDEDFTEEDLLFAENAFSPSMYGSPTPKDGLEEPDVPEEDYESDDATTDPYSAIEDGRIYYPPEDPPIMPSQRLRDADVATGFATSAEDAGFDEFEDPERFDNSDLQIESRIHEALRLHSYTQGMDIRVIVRDGVATLRGHVDDLQDIGVVEDIAWEVEGVEEVREQLSAG